jgi:hypothetical protein
MTYRNTWYLTACPVVIAVLIQMNEIFSMRRIHTATGGVVRSWTDFDRVSRAIEMNEVLAIVFMVFFGLFVALLAILTINWKMPFHVAGMHLVAFAIFTAPLGIAVIRAENKVRGILVDTADNDLKSKFDELLNDWKEPPWEI